MFGSLNREWLGLAKKNKASYGPETAEFRREFADATDALLRRRVIWFIAIWGGLTVVMFVLDLVGRMGVGVEGPVIVNGEPVGGAFADWNAVQFCGYFGGTGAWLVGYLVVLWRALRVRMGERAAFRLSATLVILDGFSAIIASATGIIPSFGGIGVFAFAYFIASCVFPWSPRQALWPALIVLGSNALSKIFIERNFFGWWGEDVLTGNERVLAIFGLVMTPLFTGPGMIVCWIRHSVRLGKFRYAFIQQRYGNLRQELAYARSIHEGLFPLPRTTGSVRFNYQYEPTRQIGGDFLHSAIGPTDDGRDERVSLVILDVTGHGIPAALTVNRLHGEIELLFADDPDIAPVEVLRRLNRYVNLTLAKHSLFATAICLRIDPQRGTIEHASGGHPPAFLLGADGSIEELGSTALLLGACSDDIYQAEQQSRPFGVADALIAYTDGVTETRDERGRMLRIDGLREMIRHDGEAGPGERPERLLSAVAAFRANLPPEDDTLIVEIYRPVGGSPESVSAKPVEADASTGSATGGRAAESPSSFPGPKTGPFQRV